MHERGKPGERRVFRRRGGVPSLASRHEFHVAVSLLDYTYHGERLRHAGEGFLDDRTAFVHRNGGFYTVAHEPVAAVRRAAA